MIRLVFGLFDLQKISRGSDEPVTILMQIPDDNTTLSSTILSNRSALRSELATVHVPFSDYRADSLLNEI
jgi:hypothetical protein